MTTLSRDAQMVYVAAMSAMFGALASLFVLLKGRAPLTWRGVIGTAGLSAFGAAWFAVYLFDRPDVNAIKAILGGALVSGGGGGTIVVVVSQAITTAAARGAGRIFGFPPDENNPPSPPALPKAEGDKQS